MAKFDPFSFPRIVPGWSAGGMQSKERKGSNFAIWQPWYYQLQNRLWIVEWIPNSHSMSSYTALIFSLVALIIVFKSVPLSRAIHWAMWMVFPGWENPSWDPFGSMYGASLSISRLDWKKNVSSTRFNERSKQIWYRSKSILWTTSRRSLLPR